MAKELERGEGARMTENQPHRSICPDSGIFCCFCFPSDGVAATAAAAAAEDGYIVNR